MVKGKFCLLIYNCPFEKKYITINGSEIKFTTKKGNHNKLYKLTSNCDISTNKTLDHKHQEECVDQILHQQDEQISELTIDVSNVSLIKEQPIFYILEYYYYNIIEIPTEYKNNIDKKFTKDNNILYNRYLMLYPELLFPVNKESPTILNDYIERYIPSFNGQFKYYSYNETLNFKINHSRIKLGIKQEDYIKFSPKEFLEYLDKIASVQTEKRMSLIDQFQNSIKILEVSI